MKSHFLQPKFQKFSSKGQKFQKFTLEISNARKSQRLQRGGVKKRIRCASRVFFMTDPILLPPRFALAYRE